MYIELNNDTLANMERLSLSDNEEDHKAFMRLFLDGGGCALLLQSDARIRLSYNYTSIADDKIKSLFAHMFDVALSQARKVRKPAAPYPTNFLVLIEKLKDDPEDARALLQLAKYYTLPNKEEHGFDPAPNAARLIYLVILQDQDYDKDDSAEAQAFYHLSDLYQASGISPDATNFSIYQPLYDLQEAYLCWVLLTLSHGDTPIDKKSSPLAQLKLLLEELTKIAELMAKGTDLREEIYKPHLFKLAHFFHGVPQLKFFDNIKKLRDDGIFDRLGKSLSQIAEQWKKFDPKNDQSLIELAAAHLALQDQVRNTHNQAIIVQILKEVQDEKAIPVNLQLSVNRVYLEGFSLHGNFLIDQDIRAALWFLKNVFMQVDPNIVRARERNGMSSSSRSFSSSSSSLSSAGGPVYKPALHRPTLTIVT